LPSTHSPSNQALSCNPSPRLSQGRTRAFADKVAQWKTTLQLSRLRNRLAIERPGSLVRCRNYHVRIADGPTFCGLYEEIFINRIYHFEAQRRDPLILDCGGNIGMSVLYFKDAYPAARIIAFEPDPSIFPYLEDNVRRNRLDNVQLIRAALANRNGNVSFYSDGKVGSFLAHCTDQDIPRGWQRFDVPCFRLRDYLVEPVDFLKMDIEGAEWEVLADSEDRLRQVSEIVVEYHRLPRFRQTLHKILELLSRNDYECLITNPTTNPGGLPPRLTDDTEHGLVVYARRID